MKSCGAFDKIVNLRRLSLQLCGGEVVVKDLAVVVLDAIDGALVSRLDRHNALAMLQVTNDYVLACFGGWSELSCGTGSRNGLPQSCARTQASPRKEKQA